MHPCTTLSHRLYSTQGVVGGEGIPWSVQSHPNNPQRHGPALPTMNMLLSMLCYVMLCHAMLCYVMQAWYILKKLYMYVPINIYIYIHIICTCVCLLYT